MKAATLKALNGSIAKWEKIVAGNEVDKGPSNCPLCQRFNTSSLACENKAGEIFPVAKKVDDVFCSGTPYEDWEYYQDKNNKSFPFNVFDAKSKRLAQEELKFLKGLLPKEAK